MQVKMEKKLLFCVHDSLNLQRWSYHTKHAQTGCIAEGQSEFNLPFFSCILYLIVVVITVPYQLHSFMNSFIHLVFAFTSKKFYPPQVAVQDW